MRVHVCRHAEAESEGPDATRPLTVRGLAQALALGDALATDNEPPTTVLASPLLRARQTAEAIADRLGALLLIDSRLALGCTVASLREALMGLTGPVVAIAHQPDCSDILYALTGADPGFPVAGHVEVAIDEDDA